jgi:hypothetical protein
MIAEQTRLLSLAPVCGMREWIFPFRALALPVWYPGHCLCKPCIPHIIRVQLRTPTARRRRYLRLLALLPSRSLVLLFHYSAFPFLSFWLPSLLHVAGLVMYCGRVGRARSAEKGFPRVAELCGLAEGGKSGVQEGIFSFQGMLWCWTAQKDIL